MARPMISPPRPAPQFGSRLRAARRARGLTAQQVAEAAGVTKGFVAQIERDETSPSVATLLRMCDALGIEVGSLFESPRSDLAYASAVSTFLHPLEYQRWMVRRSARNLASTARRLQDGAHAPRCSCPVA